MNRSEVLKYRPEIDGLRAISVMSVIIYHAGVSAISGGFIGVDVFFVISGFLITSIIMRELDNGSFSLYSFYERRAKRILPPLFITILITLPLAFFFLIPSQIKDVGQSIVAVSFFLSNYFFYLETDYFNQFNNNAPLLHTWSLAVEEQFYLIFPLLMIMLSKSRRMIITSFFLIAAFSLYFAHSGAITSPNLTFYSIHTRAWELIAGSICAFFMSCNAFSKYLDSKRNSKNLEIIAIACLVIIIASFFFFDKKTLHPSLFTLVPVLASAILITISGHTYFCKKILSNTVLVKIGLISYGLYLFHNPLFSSIDIYFDNLVDEKIYYKLMLILPVFLLSIASYLYVEKPIRKYRNIKPFRLIATSSVCLLLFSSVGLLIHKTNGFRSFYVNKLESAGMEMLVDVESERARILKLRERYFPSDQPFDCEDGCSKILLLGDSFGNDAYMSMSTIASHWQVRYIYLDDECMADFIAADMEGEPGIKCKNKDVIAGELLKQATNVVITAKWQESTYQAGFDLARYIESSYQKEITLVGSILFTDLASLSIKAWRSDMDLQKLPEITYKYQRWDRVRISDKLKSAVKQQGTIKWIDKKHFFCDYRKETCNLFDEKREPLIWDNAHLTSRAYAAYGKFLADGVL